MVSLIDSFPELVCLGCFVIFIIKPYTGTLGSIVGALVSRKMSSLRGIIKTLMAVTVLEMILSSSVLLNCPERTILNSPLEVDNGDSKTNNRDINGLCYDNCQCSPSLFQPVCAESSKETYFSACYAGCMNEMQDCKCVGNESDWNHANRKVEDGFCEVDCTQKYLAAIGKHVKFYYYIKCC